MCSGRCCSVVACTTIHQRREETSPTPQVFCTKCRRFHGDVGDYLSPCESMRSNEAEDKISVCEAESPIVSDDVKSITENLKETLLQEMKIEPVSDNESENASNKSVRNGRLPSVHEYQCEASTSSKHSNKDDDFEIIFSSDLKSKKKDTKKPGMARRIDVSSGDESSDDGPEPPRLKHPLEVIDDSTSIKKENENDSEDSEPDEDVPLLTNNEANDNLKVDPPLLEDINDHKKDLPITHQIEKKKCKKKFVIPYRMTPEGTKVNFLCDMSMYFSFLFFTFFF